jgi:pyruvate dehydrogenase E2 component (dihydrolipoamide acetyltransferase)
VPKEIRMPKLSDTMEEGTLLQWRKREGDPIRRGEVLADVETDKADMEFESYTEGTIAKLVVEPGATVPVGTLIAIIRLPGESDADVAASLEGSGATARAATPAAAAARPAPAAPVAPAAPAGPAPAAAPRAARAPAAAPPAIAPAPAALPPAAAGERVSPPIAEDGRLRATPRARRLAEEKSIDLGELEGSGPGGAILVADVEGYLAELEAQEPDAEGVRATPVALRMASDLGVDLEQVKGTGPGGRITKADLGEHVRREKRRSSEREETLFRGAVQLSQKRKALIRAMVRSKAEAPHFYVSVDVRTDALRELRNRVNDESGEKRTRLTYTHLMIKAAAMALERFPEVNAVYRPEENDVALYEPINIGLAVDVNDELVAPTIKDCQGKSVFQLADEANRLIQRARMRKLQPEDYADGTFTISNLGMFGVDSFYAIITPPQSSILSVGSMKPRPIVQDGQVAVGSVTNLGLSVDHRVLDGVKATLFLAELQRLLEAPDELVRDAHTFGS